MSSTNGIAVGWDEDFLALGLQYNVNWLSSTPHIVICGASGTGKTYAAQQVLARVGKEQPDAHIYLLDYKADDFKFLNGCKRYYPYDAVCHGLDEYHKSFETRQKGADPSRSLSLLYVDEWAAYCQSLDKKQAELEQKRLAKLLMLGRSYNMRVVLGCQRADAQYFGNARDNLGAVLGLGNLSDESKQMLFAKEHREQMKPDRCRGTGYFYSDATGLHRIVIPTVSNYDKMQQYIKEAVDRA